MNLKAIRNVFTSKIGRQILTVQKHSPTLLFGAGVVGIVGTVILASRATLKMEEILTEHQETVMKINDLATTVTHLKTAEYTEEARQKDIVYLYSRTIVKVGRLYAPAVGLGVLSIAALTGSHFILSRRNVAITAAYAALDRGFREYRQRVVNELGIDKDREFRYDMEDRQIVVETAEGPQVKTIKQPGKKAGSIYARFFDQFSVNWSPQPSYNQLFISCQQNYANDLLHSRGHVFLNEVYDMLGLSRSKEGAVVGWLKGMGDDYIDFGVFEGDRHSGMRFVLGQDDSILLDFNVDGLIYDKLDERYTCE